MAKAANKPSHRNSLRDCALIATLGGLAFVVSAVFPIPYPWGGYFNFGDAFILTSSMLFGPLIGAGVGILSGVLSDASAGYFLFIPFTILAKALLGLGAGLFREKKIFKYVMPFFGCAAEVLIYLLAYLLLYGSAGLLSSAFDCLQAFGCLLLSFPLSHLAKKALR